MASAELAASLSTSLEAERCLGGSHCNAAVPLTPERCIAVELNAVRSRNAGSEELADERDGWRRRIEQAGYIHETASVRPDLDLT